MKGHSEREAKGVVPDCCRLTVEDLGERKKGVDPPRLLEVELPMGVESCISKNQVAAVSQTHWIAAMIQKQ